MSKESNANRELPADQVIALFRKRLPKMLGGIGADRDWLWWAGAKPDEATRKILGEMGWRFSGKPHELTIGDKQVSAHWYHSCGGKIVFRRRGRPAESDTEQAEETASPATPAPQPARQSSAVSNLFNLLNRNPR